MALFSKRHKRALASGELRVELAQPLRVRVRRLMERYDDSYRDEYNNYTSNLEALQRDLLDAYGDTALRIPEQNWDGTTYHQAAFNDWIKHGPAYGVLDAIEGYERHIPGAGSPSARS